jgi:hypothetical protein
MSQKAEASTSMKKLSDHCFVDIYDILTNISPSPQSPAIARDNEKKLSKTKFAIGKFPETGIS